jgi:hypothetical protein
MNTACADPSLNPVVSDETCADNDLDLEAVTLLQCSCESSVSRPAVIDERADLPFVRFSYIKGRGKAISLQVLTEPEGSKRMRLPDFKTIGT